MVPNGPPSFPSPASAKVSYLGANKLEKNTCLIIFNDFNAKKKVPGQGGVKRGPRENYTRPFFQLGPKRGNPYGPTVGGSQRREPQKKRNQKIKKENWSRHRPFSYAFAQYFA